MAHDGLEPGPTLTCDWREVKGQCLLRIVISDCGFHHLSCHFSVQQLTAKMEKLMTPNQSSVLMTPSSVKSVGYSPRVLSPLSLLSPAATPKTPLNLPPSPPAFKDILSTLYLGGVPQVAERIVSLLNPADLCCSQQVCTTWNDVCSGAQFMSKVNTYRRQCKENVENLHKTEEPMEITVSPVKRRPLAAFTLNTQTRFQTTKTTSPTPFNGKCIKPWHEGDISGGVSPSKRPRQSEAICCTKKSKKRLRRL